MMMRLLQLGLCFLAVFFSSYAHSETKMPSTAFFYAANPPVDLLATYKRVVLEAENTTAEELAYLKKRGVKVYAYLSIGEEDSTRPWFKKIKSSWKKTENKAWNSAVMDMTSQGWHDFLLKRRMKALWKRGYRGFFLDTMDSFNLFAKTPEERTRQQEGMVKLLKSMKTQYKGVGLLFNRGFEILDQAADLADGIVAESLYHRWNAEKKAYTEVSEGDREWLLGKLNEAKDKYKLPVVSIDYLPPSRRDEAEVAAKKITEHGFVPWISTPALDYMGVGSVNLVPRKVLFLFDSHDQPLASHEIHRFLAMPLEYLGYVPDYRNISERGLPDDILKGRYAGIVVWLSKEKPERDDLIAKWALKQVNDEVPIAFMGGYTLGANEALNQRLGIGYQTTELVAPLNLEVLSENMGFEIKPQLRPYDLPLIKSDSTEPWLQIVDMEGQALTPVFISPWGGVAIDPYVTQMVPTLIEYETYTRWILNPFEFLKAALKLETIPVPDHTTESGNRILTIHIDGDGFYNKTELGGNRYSPELITDEFLIPHSLPHTVSIIEGEIGKAGLKPDLSPELEEIARGIFKLDNIEIASHSFSHPFNWMLADATKNDVKKAAPKSDGSVFKEEAGHYHLPIPDYAYRSEREIKGSIDYINKVLAPKGKKTKVFLWTGDCLPNEDALMWTKRMNVVNLNGGDSVMRKGMESVTNVSASGIVRGPYFQPYAQIQNENVYTNDWLGPYYGFQRVIETFDMTNLPRRFKPISIYYHFYSGDRLASVRALHRVYDWAIAEETLPLWISEYTERLDAFRAVTYEKRANGWRFHNAKDITTFRFEDQKLHPDFVSSDGVSGYRKLPQGLFVSLERNQDTVNLNLTDTQAQYPYLKNANARVMHWNPKPLDTRSRVVEFRLKGHQPLEFSLMGLHKKCKLTTKTGVRISGKKQKDGSTLFKMTKKDTGNLRATCGK
ncbi:MAG: endo alpha-1,4 polygalactosaminidase [Methylococcales bacterium]|nr:endo alpha-1,4 polygalactosaminidase [Methylococcales bacterium]